MRNGIKSLLNNSFIRNVMVVVSGTVAAQIITMALSPFITRLYGPEAFGVMGVFMSILAVVTPIAALTYPIAIVLPKNNQEAKDIAKLSLWISVVISGLIGLLLIAFKGEIIELFNFENLSSFLYLIPLSILFSGFFQVLEQWIIRMKHFGITAKATFFEAIVTQGGMVSIGLYSPVVGVLIVLSALRQGVKVFFLYIILKKEEARWVSHEKFDEHVPVGKLVAKYKDFPIYRAPQVLINAFSSNLPIIMLSAFFGPAPAGFYTLSRSVMGIPTQLIGKSVGDVLYPRISEAAINGENLTRLLKKSTITLAALGVIPFGIVILLGPRIFGFVFGIDWVIAGEYARWIALGVFFSFVYQPCIKAFPVLSIQSFHLKFTVVALLIDILVLLIGYNIFSNDVLTIALFGVTNALVNASLILLTFHKSKRYDERKTKR